jgi:FliI/YscN family ATPase
MSIQPFRSPRSSGRITALTATTFQARLPFVAVGDLCTAHTRSRGTITAQVVSCANDLATLSAIDRSDGLMVGSLVTCDFQPPSIRPGDHMLGCILNARGERISSQPRSSIPGSPRFTARRPDLLPKIPVSAPPPEVHQRVSIRERFITGVRPIDLLVPFGIGQRVGIFASAGLGKSTLIHQLACAHSADVTVIALVGERGREVPDFLEAFSSTDRSHSYVAVIATADEPPLARYLAALTATTIAEHFRDQGRSVLLIVDSLTRVARALREIGISGGELPVRQGYPNSVYLKLSALLERPGRTGRGAITAIYTVLTNTEGDLDPLADEIKSLLDGHLVLALGEVERGVRPAIDYLASVSRVESSISSEIQMRDANLIRLALARVRREKAMVAMGMSPDPQLARFLECEPLIHEFLCNRLKAQVLVDALDGRTSGGRTIDASP